MTDTPTSTAAAPGWYPDGSGGQRWWDGRDWTEHTAAGAASATTVGDRPALPAGATIDTGWVWVVALLNLVQSIPIFFVDMSGYVRAILEAESSGNAGAITESMAGYFVIFAIFGVIGWVCFAFLVFSAYRDYKHLQAIGVVRPFHWAFAFIPYPIVYLIGRHVVLRKVSSTTGWPLWAHIASYVVLLIASFVWAFAMMQSMFAELASYSFT